MEVKGTCAAIKVRANAYLNSSGDQWECNRGFREIDGICVAIKVPRNGYLADYSNGTGWECNRGYRAVKETCAAVKVPANGYFAEASYGPGWKCNRGYRAAALNGRIYVIGGHACDAPSFRDTVFYATPGPDGSIPASGPGAWNRLTFTGW